MGPWEVTGEVAAILVAVVVGATVVGAMTLVRVRRRRRDAVERLPDEGLLREQALERLRQVQAQWEGRAGTGAAEATRQEPPAPTGGTADRSPAPGRATSDTWPGPAHVERRPRSARGGSLARTVVAVVVLAVLVAAALSWLTWR